MVGRAITLAALALSAAAQLPWSSPHHYPGKPEGDYSPVWQDYFEVTEPLPNVSFPLPRSWAGSISTKTPNMANNSAFFWAFEHSNGSFTSNSTEPWSIWLAGGPGYSSIASALLENGPISVTSSYDMVPNNYSWHQIADMVYVDNPVGVGFSTVGQGGYASDEDDVAADIMGFIQNLVAVFPTLQTRPLIFTGESYSARFLGYWMKLYFSLDPADRPVNFTKIVIGNPALQDASVYENIPVLQLVETYPQIIDYDTSMYAYIKEQSNLCHYDLNLTYPQTGGNFEDIQVYWGELGRITIGETTAPPGPNEHRKRSSSSFMGEVRARYDALSAHDRLPRVRDEGRKKWMKENFGVSGIQQRGQPNDPITWNTTLTGHIGKWYGCDLFYLALEYSVNWTYPWSAIDSFDYLSVPYVVNPVKEVLNPYTWMNDNATRNAIHAPYNEQWTVIEQYPWGNVANGPDPSVETMAFMDEMAANCTANNVSILWYSGNDDALTPHWSTLTAIQNTTFGGIQGFTVEPNTPWYDDAGEYAGIVHQERGWTFVVVYGAGHQIPVTQPLRSFTLAREFIFGNNDLGSVKPGGHVVTTVAPASATPPATLPDGVLVGQPDLIALEATTTEIIVWPTASIAAWDAYLESVIESSLQTGPTSTSKSTSTSTSASTKTTSSTTFTSTSKTSSSSSSKTSTSSSKGILPKPTSSRLV